MILTVQCLEITLNALVDLLEGLHELGLGEVRCPIVWTRLRAAAGPRGCESVVS